MPAKKAGKKAVKAAKKAKKATKESKKGACWLTVRFNAGGVEDLTPPCDVI